VKAGCGKTARPVWAADGGQRESIERASSDPTAGKPTNKAVPTAAEPVEPRVEAKGNASQQSTRRTQSRVSVSHALEHIRQTVTEKRFAVIHPRWEPSARMGPARICAGGAQ
jgi:hypothetical protein